MNSTKFFAAAMAALSTFALPAIAHAQEAAPSQGHYEWRQAQQYGPRAPIQPPRRVWVADNAEVANCDCAMMKMAPADCMRGKHGMMMGKDGMMSPSSGVTAS